MGFVILADNLLDGAALQVTPAGGLQSPISRLTDGDRFHQFRFGGSASWDMPDVFPIFMAMGPPSGSSVVIDIDLGSAQAVSGWALLNHNVGGSVTLHSGNAYPPATLRDTEVAVSGTDFLSTFAEATARYWRITIPQGLVSIGEALLGAVLQPSTNPALDGGVVGADVGNVQADESEGGYVWAVVKGEDRRERLWTWELLPEADLTIWRTWYSQIQQGARPFVVTDPEGVTWWARYVGPRLEWRHRRTSATYLGLQLRCLEAL